MSAAGDDGHRRRVAAASLVSGAASGVMGVATGYPLETLRVRVQTQSHRSEFRGPLDCLFKTVRGEGILGLYKGMASPLLGATITKTVNFGTFGFLLASLRERGATEADALHIVAAGAASAVVASFVLTPVDRAKILLQVQRSAQERARAEGRTAGEGTGERLYRGPRDVWREQGRGMWRGQGVTSLREVVYGSLYFSVFEQLKSGASWALGTGQLFSHATGTSHGLPFGALLLCGGLTGAVVWTFMFPIDVVKSKMQADRARSGPSAWAVARQHWAAEGAAGFFKGWSAAMTRSLPAHAVVLATYTKIMQLLL